MVVYVRLYLEKEKIIREVDVYKKNEPSVIIKDGLSMSFIFLFLSDALTHILVPASKASVAALNQPFACYKRTNGASTTNILKRFWISSMIRKGASAKHLQGSVWHVQQALFLSFLAIAAMLLVLLSCAPN